MKTKLLTIALGLLLLASPAIGQQQKQQPPPIQPMTSLSPALRFFVAMDGGSYASEADALSSTRLPKGTELVTDFKALPGPSKIFVFRAPPGTTDALDGIQILILQPAKNGSIHLWLSGTDLARGKREEAIGDVDNFKEVGGGSFQIFERQ
jgi:hypothetical protein